MKYALILLILIVPVMFISNDYQNKKIITEQQKTIEKKDSIIKQLIIENQSVAVIEPAIFKVNDTIEYMAVIKNLYNGTILSDKYSYQAKNIDDAINGVNELIMIREKEILMGTYPKNEFIKY